MPNNPTSSPTKTDWISRLLWGAFAVSALLTVILGIRSCRGSASPTVEGQSSSRGNASPTPSLEPAPDLDDTRPLQASANRPGAVKLDMENTVYVLFTGLDLREWEEDTGPGLTDTMIVAALDPQRGTAALISLPRDLWVEIPGYGPHKINQAFMLGEWKAYPGGGPALMMETVGDLLGVQIDHYVQVNFDAFVTLVDAVEGVKVDVQERILVDPDPSVDGDMKRLKTGIQVLRGDLALGYVRTRSTPEGDFGRAKRQQQVLVSLQEKLFTYKILPRLIRQLPSLYRDLNEDVETNLTLKQIATLAWAARDINPEQLEATVISPPLVTAGFNNQEQYVLFPDVESIRKVWSDLLVPTATQVPAATSDPVEEPTPELSHSEQLAAENASLAVLNGTNQPGLAGRTADFLTSQGLQVGRIDNADGGARLTKVYDYTGKPSTVAFLLDLMELSESHLYHRAGAAEGEDIVIVLGEDWSAENPLPEE